MHQAFEDHCIAFLLKNKLTNRELYHLTKGIILRHNFYNSKTDYLKCICIKHC